MRQLICLLLLLICSYAAHSTVLATLAQSVTPINLPPKARYLSVLDAQALRNINVVFQSTQGIIWLGTQDGLIRFDGYSATRFNHDSQNNQTISHNTITGITEDHQNNIWVTTLGGLNRYNPNTEKFQRISLRVGKMDFNLTDNLNSLVSLQQHLWVGTDRGLKRLDYSQQQAVKLPGPLQTLEVANIHALLATEQKLWIATLNGVYLYHQSNLRHYPLAKSPTAVPSTLKLNQLIEGPNGAIWLATSAGLYKLTPDANQFTPVQFTPAQADQQNIAIAISSLAFDAKQALWLGSTDNGAYIYQTQSQQLTKLNGSNDVYNQYDRSNISHIMQDQQQSMWLATEQGMIFVTKTALEMQAISDTDGKLTITDIQTLPNFGAAFAGNHQYYEYQLANNAIKPYLVNENRVYRLSRNHDNDIFIATLGEGIQQYNRNTRQLTQFEHLSTANYNLPITRFYDAYVDGYSKLWLLPFPDLPQLNGGVISFHPQSNNQHNHLQQAFIKDIIELDEQQLLVSSDTLGLVTINQQDHQVKHWKKSHKNSPRISIVLYKDSRDILWVGTLDQGLARYLPQQKSFEYINTKHGLISNKILSITEDNTGHLWLGSEKGLSRLEPQSKTLVNIESQDGLPLSKFYKRAAQTDNQGRLWFGGQQGMVFFTPKDIKIDSEPLKVVINDFKLFNQSISWQANNPNNPLKQPIELTQSLVLDHKNYMFSFGFSTNEFIRPDKIQFAYKMEGLDDNWVYTNAANRVASYTTLKPNDYIFKVKVSDRNGVWSQQTAQIKISVLPPWWLSWQAYIGYFTFCIIAAYLSIANRTRKLVRHAIALEENVAQRTKELQDSRDQVGELLAQKQQLFASVSHEFRTPLTLILSPVEQLINDKRGQPIQSELQLVKRNGRRLLRMVDQLLEFAKLELHDNNQKETVTLAKTVEIIVSSFELLVKTKHIDISINRFEDVSLNLIPDSLNKILINILSNAFKYSPENSSISINIDNHINTVVIAISDTGVGIAEHDLKAVFQRFNRATQGHTEAVPGAGIGLALVKELIEANDGEITLISELGKGSTFTVTLPCQKLAQQHNNQLTQEQLIQADNDDAKALIQDTLDLEIDSVTMGETSQNNEGKNNSINLDELIDNGQKSILIVDDNADLRQLLHNQLSGKYQCLTAENGEQGLNIAKEQLPDLVISDVMMPIMDGFELTQALKSDELTCHMPVILLTAKGSMENRMKGLQLLADDYLAKPFNIEEVMLRVHNILAIRDILKQRYRQAIDNTGTQQHTNGSGNGLNLNLGNIQTNEAEQSFINKVNEQLTQHHNDSDFNARTLSRALCVSERQLQRKLKAQFDLSFPELLRNHRLNQALELLKSGQRVSQIYHEVGFSSHSYFSSCFKAKFGQTPKNYQQDL